LYDKKYIFDNKEFRATIIILIKNKDHDIQLV